MTIAVIRELLILEKLMDPSMLRFVHMGSFMTPQTLKRGCMTNDTIIRILCLFDKEYRSTFCSRHLRKDTLPSHWDQGTKKKSKLAI
jgi:hypothetical protein